MRWFKHMTNTRDDERIARLISEFGLEAYGFYWAIIEIIARQIEKEPDKCSVTYPLTYLAHQLYLHHNKVGFLLGNLEVTGLILLSKSVVGGRVNYTITCPNLLKYRDEYTSRKLKNRDNIPTVSRQTPEQDTDTDTDTEAETDLKKINKKSSTHFKKCARVLKNQIEIPASLKSKDFLAAWEAWNKYRKEIRKSLSPSTAARQLKMLEKMGVEKATVSISESITNGWAGLFEPKMSQKRKGNWLEDLQNLDLGDENAD